jgi:hypothetical protein
LRQTIGYCVQIFNLLTEKNNLLRFLFNWFEEIFSMINWYHIWYISFYRAWRERENKNSLGIIKFLWQTFWEHRRSERKNKLSWKKHWICERRIKQQIQNIFFQCNFIIIFLLKHTKWLFYLKLLKFGHNFRKAVSFIFYRLWKKNLVLHPFWIQRPFWIFSLRIFEKKIEKKNYIFQ